ncbi:unnamed protein product, partial [Mesorhabditis spiculigera]
MCAGPPEFRVNVRHDVASTSVFKAQSHGVQEIRNIGTEHWPLKLDVDFHRVPHLGNHPSDQYYLRACIETVRTNHRDCFINETFRASEMEDCNVEGRAASLPILVSGGLVSLFFLSAFILVAVVIHRLYRRLHGHPNRKRGSFTKQQHSSQLLPSHQSRKPSLDDDRLTVIAEEEESDDDNRCSPTFDKPPPIPPHTYVLTDASLSDKSWMPLICSPRRDSSSSGFGSEPLDAGLDGELVIPPLIPSSIRSQTMVTFQPSRSTLQTFRPLANQV